MNIIAWGPQVKHFMSWGCSEIRVRKYIDPRGSQYNLVLIQLGLNTPLRKISKIDSRVINGKIYILYFSVH